MFEAENILLRECVVVPMKATTRNEAITELVNAAVAAGVTSSPDDLVNGLIAREDMRHTVVFPGIAFPRNVAHGVNRPFVCIGRFAEPVIWDVHGGPVQTVVLYGFPSPKNLLYLKLLTHLSKCLFPMIKRDILNSDRSADDLYHIAQKLLGQ